MPNPQDKFAALQMGLDGIKDDGEARNQAYEQLKAIYNDKTQPMADRARAQKNMEAIVPSGFWNNAQGVAYGAGEGLVTPFVMEGLRKITGGWVNPGVPTTENTAARIGGNVGGSVFGLGKIGGAMKLAQASPKAFAGIMAGYGLGQGAGGHIETERNKGGQREFLGATNQEIPKYLNPTPMSSGLGVANVLGQGALSAISGGIGQKATLAGKTMSLPTVLSQMTETGGSTGLSLLDSFGGVGGLKQYASENPDGIKQMAGTALGMSLGGAVGVPLAQKYMNRGGNQSPSPQAAPPPLPPQRSTLQPNPARGPAFNPQRVEPDRSLVHGFQLDNIQKLINNDLSGLEAMRKSQIPSKYGTYYVNVPKEDGTMRTLQLTHRFGDEEISALGGNKMSNRWMAMDPQTREYLSLTRGAVEAPGARHYQAFGQPNSMVVDDDVFPSSYQPEVKYYGDASDTPRSGIMIGSAPKDETKQYAPLVYVQDKQTGEVYKVPGDRLIPDPETEAARAVVDRRGEAPKKIGMNTISSDPQVMKMKLQELDNTIFGPLQQRVDSLVGGSVIPQQLPVSRPTTEAEMLLRNRRRK